MMPRKEDSESSFLGAVQGRGPQLPSPPMRAQWLVAVSQTRSYHRVAGVGRKSTPAASSSELCVYKGFSRCRKRPDFRALAHRYGLTAPSSSAQWFFAWQIGLSPLPPQPQGVSHPELEPLLPPGCSLSPCSNRKLQSHPTVL